MQLILALRINNSSIAFEGGIGLNLLDGNLTTLAITHLGPENPHNNHDYRYLNDITTTWKITKNFTPITDLNLIYDTISKRQMGRAPQRDTGEKGVEFDMNA